MTPGVNYIASISPGIQDQNGNSLDCFGSKEVDDNCEWNFKASGTSSSDIMLSPTSGPVGTSVDITGTGFAPNIHVAITFDGNIVNTNPSPVTTDSNGKFTANIIIPVSSSGPHSIAANLASKTFTVTSSTTPIIILNPNSGLAGTSVNVTGKGYAPSSTVTITFDGIPVITNPTTVSTNAAGEFGASFILPSSASGDHTVKAARGASTASAAFRVTSLTTLSSPNFSEKITLPNVFG